MENEKIGILCGNGKLPLKLAELHKNVLFILLKEANADKSLYQNKEFCEIRAGRVGKIISTFKTHKISKIYIAGGIKKPNFSITSLMPDFAGLKLILRVIRLKNKGDNNLLTCLISFISEYNIQVLSQDVLKSSFSYGTPTKQNISDGKIGLEILNTISHFDIGQTISIQNGVVLGLECLEGTDSLIVRSSSLSSDAYEKPVLIKSKKNGQTSKADLPTIGLSTVQNCIKAGFKGIFYNQCIILDEKEITVLLKQNNFFITPI